MHRKANRTDIDTLLEAKADAADLDKLLTLLESKADLASLDHLAHTLGEKVDRADFSTLVNDMAGKCDRADVDMYVRAVQGQRVEWEARQKDLEKEFDQVVDTVRREVEGLKQSTLMAMSKKADFTLVDGLREQVQKKVDHEYLVTTASKIKSEC